MPTTLLYGTRGPLRARSSAGAYIEAARAEVKAWETEKPCSLKQVADSILGPEEKAVAALVPKNITGDVGKAVERRLSVLAPRAKVAKSRAEGTAAGSFAAHPVNHLQSSPVSLAGELEAADKEARKTWSWYIRCAAADEGAGDPASSGLLALPAQVPLLVATLIWQIQAMGCCYGYDLAREGLFLLLILEMGTAPTLKAKAAFLKKFERAAGKCAGPLPRELLLEAIRKTAKTLGVQIAQRKALQGVPIIEALTGASFNGMIAHDVGQAAYMCYRRRWIAEYTKQA